MYGKNIVLLDGTPAGDDSLAPQLVMLREVLQESGAVLTTFTLRGIKMAHCIGCFGCWVESPGECIGADAGREIAKAIVRSDTTILFTPLTFGGYSSALKKLVDRWLPLTLPFFRKLQGELHHTPRYPEYPRLIAMAVQKSANEAEAEVFRMVVGRNAINFHAPSFAAEVIVANDSADMQRQQMHAMLIRHDPFPYAKAVTSIMPPHPASKDEERSVGARRALLLIGSPKVKSPSTSSVLGSYLLDRLRDQGWQTESLTLNASLQTDKGEIELLAAVDRCDLLVLAFPLYIDALPYHVTRALEIIAADRQAYQEIKNQGVLAISNNGFPEPQQNVPALAICHQFALQCGFSWAGGLAVGAGEALSSGEPLSAYGRKKHPPTRHVMQALELAAEALSAGNSVPERAQKLFDKCPLPLVPFSFWTWLFATLGGRGWYHRAAQFDVAKRDLYSRPYADVNDEA